MEVEVKEIIRGWKNFVSKSELTESEALKKAKICAECPFIEKAFLLSYVKESEDFKQIEGFRCGLCKCPTSALIRSNKACSDNPPRF